MRADLHMHTNASDGQYSPAELIELTRQFDVIAITDHDTTEGIEPAQQAALKYGAPTIIPGVELSAEDTEGDVHMLGYHIDIHNAPFQQTLTHFRDTRFERGRLMLEKLATMGMPLDWQQVVANANGAAIGRPHVARALLASGYVESIKDAFDRFIGNDGPAYIARARLTPEEAVALIHQAGGVAVLAHPGLLKDYRAVLLRLIAVGLDGIEVIHPSNSETVRLDLRGIAVTSMLIMTGGSDFHGPKIKPDVTLGMVSPPEGAVEALALAAKRYAH